MEFQLSPKQVEALLYELCVVLGFCLPPAANVRLMQEPPADVDIFADAVIKAEGLDPYADIPLHLRRDVRARVAKHFRAAEDDYYTNKLHEPSFARPSRTHKTMKTNNINTIGFFALLFSALTIRAAEFDLGSRGVLSVETPKKWTVNGRPASRPDGTQIGYALAIKPLNEANAKCLITFAYVKKGPPDQERIRKDVLEASEQFVASSVEKTRKLNDFSLKQGYGAYCVFTDASLVGKAPTKDDYKVMGSGILQLSDEVVGVVSIFADEIDSPEFKAMLQAVNSLKLKTAK